MAELVIFLFNKIDKCNINMSSMDEMLKKKVNFITIKEETKKWQLKAK